MSNTVLPTLVGLKWDISKAPEFSTTTQRAANLAELRISYSAVPIWHYKAAYDILRASVALAELQQLVGMFTSMYGDWDSWLYTDPTDYSVTAYQFGVGDGSTAAFQLSRSYGGFSEPVANLNGAPLIYKNGTLLTGGAYTISATGLVTFAVVPALSDSLTWTGQYYYRCVFSKNMLEFNQFMHDLWELQQMDFRGTLGTKLL